MKKILTMLQAALLVSALALIGVSFTPTPAEATWADCLERGCPGGVRRCDRFVHPVTGEVIQCSQN